MARPGIALLSPERFIESNDGRVETKPIKGTASGDSLVEDQRLAEELVNSSKDRAENLMIVDLLRNDPSKNCESGSIAVPKLFELESFSNVHHLVSTVSGKLNPDSGPLDLLRDCFQAPLPAHQRYGQWRLLRSWSR